MADRSRENVEAEGTPSAPEIVVSGAPAMAPVESVLALQRSAGNQAVARALAAGRLPGAGGPALLRQTNTQTDIQRLDEMLDRFNVPEEDVIALISRMSDGDKGTVATDAYRGRIASALNFREMMQVVRVLPLTLEKKLEWLQAAALLTSGIDYGEIRSLVTGAPQNERDALKNDRWKRFFVSVCTNATMVTALNDLGFDLETKLTWLRAEMTVTSWELDYPTIQPWITAAPQGERDALKKDQWKSFFVDVCTNATMMTALNDLGFDLETKLRWLRAEMTVTSWELDYVTIQPWITAAPQGERNALKKDEWKSFFVDVCTNATMVTALNDLGFDLETKLSWLWAEMTVTSWELDYVTIQPWITAAPQGERNALRNDKWKGFFVSVCTDATMETAVTDLAFDLRDKLRWLIAEGNGYASFKTIITAAGDKATALGDASFLLELKAHHSWDDFAKCVELLGRTIPGGGALIADATVQAALAAAWAASNPAVVPAPPGPAPPGLHEEGGFIYLDIVTNTITTDRVSPGAQASLPLNSPNPPDNAITVGGYHTHPNVGPAWGAPFASGADTAWANRNGIPLLLRGAFPVVANTSDTFTGPARLHLAGNRGFPGATGGIAPQAPLNRDDLDEL